MTRHTARYYAGKAAHPYTAHVGVYGIESPIPCSWCLWLIPGTDCDDPAFEQSGAMAAYARAHRTHYWLGQYPVRA